MNKRAVLLLFIVLFLFSVILSRFFYIQTTKEIKGQDLQALGEERWASSQVLKGVRGTIYDRFGGVLAEELTSYTVYAVLNQDQASYVKDPSDTAKKLAPYVNMDEGELERLLSSDKFQVELGAHAKNLTHERMEEIKNLKLPGIFFREEPKRYYPKQTFASHVIGYTERDMKTSRMGLEDDLDELLRAEDGVIKYQSDRKGIPLPDPNRHITPAKNGYDVYLTIDSNIQVALEQVMTKVEAQYKPNKIVAIVADPKTGEILAMSNRPSFNPNEYENITNYINYAVSDRYEPGSTMKMFTVAAAIEEGVYNGQGEWYQSGKYRIGPNTISDHNQGRGWGSITYDEGFLRSSNVAMAKLALEKLKPEKLYEYWNRFGFTEPTGIDLPNETTSLIANHYPIDAATTAFGQGTAVTPIQQIQAATAIANDGKMMKPHVVDRIENPETGTVVQKTEPEIVGEPISKETAKKMRNLLEQVVTASAGTGKSYYLEGFDVIGKTGTAQIPKPNGKGYLHGRGQNIFSFLGMAPKDDPRVIVYVAVDRPNLAPHEAGSEPTAMIFNTIMKQSLQYLNIAPTMQELKEQVETGFVTEDYINQSVSETKARLEEEGLEVVVLGNGAKIVAQMPTTGKGMLAGERIFLRTDGNVVQMPDMNGWSIRDVRKFAEVMEMNPTIFGHGYVKKQSIEPDSTIQPGDYAVIELQLRQEEQEETGEDQESEDGEEEEQSEEEMIEE